MWKRLRTFARVARFLPSPRRLPRRLFFLLLIAATGYLVYDRIGRRAWMQYELLAAERELTQCVDPIGALIFDGNENTAAERNGIEGWQRVDDSFVGFGSWSVEARAVVRSAIPDAMQRLDARYREIGRFDELRTVPVTSGGGGPGGLFAGGSANPSILTTREWISSNAIDIFARRMQSGPVEPRIVIVQLFSCSADKCVYFRYAVRKPQNWFNDVVHVFTDETATIPGPAGQTRELVLLPDDPKKGVRIYAVQPDSADAGRFFFDYEVNGLRGTIEGKLQPDDTVKWAALSGPAADPNWNADLLRPAR